MAGFSIFVVTLLVIGITSFIVGRLFPRLIAYFLRKKLKLNVSIGGIGLGWPYLTLKDVSLTRNGFSMQIEEVALRSSFLSSEVSKLLLVIIKDVRIKKDIGSGKEQERLNRIVTESRKKQALDLRNTKVPPVIITVTQFMAVHIYRMTVMLLRPEVPEWLIHAAAEELLLDGSVVHGARLLTSIKCSSASAKILKRHPEHDEHVHVVLGELTFGLALEATLLAQGPVSFEKLSVDIERTQAVINEGFYECAQQGDLFKRRKSEVSIHQENPSVQGLSAIIPKDFKLNVMDGITITGMRDHSRPEFQAVLKTVTMNSEYLSIDSDTVPFELNMLISFAEFNIKCNHMNMLQLQKFSLDVKVQEEESNIEVLLDNLDATYNHRDIHKWICYNFAKKSKKQEVVRKLSSRQRIIQENPSILEIILLQCNTNIELYSFAVTMQLPEQQQACVGFHSTRLSLQPFTPDEQENTSYPLSADLSVNQLWCRLGASFLSYIQDKSLHVKGTPVYLGDINIQFNEENNVKLKLDSARFEWSSLLTDFLGIGARCIVDYTELFPKSKSEKSGGKANKIDVKGSVHQFTFSALINNSNIFFVVNKDVSFMARLDIVKFENNKTKSTISLEGAKMVVLKSKEFPITCVKSSEIKGIKSCVNLKKMKLSYKKLKEEIYITIIEILNIKWSANFHLHCLQLNKNMKDFISNIKDSIQYEEKPSVDSSEDSKIKNKNLTVKGLVSIDVKISSKHDMRITSEQLSAEITSDGGVCIISQKGRISIDNSDVFFIDGLHVKKIYNNDEIKLERANNEGFVLPWNKTWGVTINTLSAKFPYNLNFTEAFQNEFVSLYKWLKIVHNKKRSPFTSRSPLPPDLFIKVQEFVFEMSDDPFEVKLRRNFELLENEYQESLKRQKMLDAKVEELQRANLLLPSVKFDELYAGLSKKNADIYIQRSRQMQQIPPRTRLFAWTMQEVEILAMADPSIHGTDRALTVMTEIDCDSPWPEKGLEFTTLWCRAIRSSFKEWKFLLRDFPQPLLHISNMLIWGRLVGAEQEATYRAKRTCIVELGEPFGNETIERSMTSLKFYHDFSCDAEDFTYAFGPCWEPVIAQCNLSFERISSPSRDPSPPLPFWDKMRLLFHGRLTMSVRKLTVLLHASLDPYNTTEEMEVTWRDVVMDWTTAKFVFKGDLNIYVRTASKYDDCKLLQLPNLKLTIKLNWICLSDPNDHHSVMPCAPNKLPEYSSNQIHDSFRAFRSQHVNASIALETKAINQANSVDYPLALLYGSTLRWFESLKLILSGVTRPTRRGPLFKNVRPRKLQLSRHYRRIHLLIGLHRFQVCYWMSFAMQRGFELTGGRVSSSSEHILNLLPVGDGLIHRPRAEWSIGYMNCELNDAEIWLQSAFQEETGKEQVSLRQPVEKCYFLSLAKVSYGRETSVGKEMRSADTPHHRLVVYDLKGAWTKSNREVAFALFDSFVKAKQLKRNLSTHALKAFRNENAGNNTPMKTRTSEHSQVTSPSSSLQSVAPSTMTKQESGHAATAMLQQLIAEAENKAVVFSDDLSTPAREQLLQGVAACREDDVLFENWHVVLVNSQVLLKGCETKGYVIMSAAKAQILQRIHRPVWKQHTLVSKSTWVGSLECMQYYATVSAGKNDILDDNIMWLTVDNIEEKDSTVISELPDVPQLVGSGQSVGGVVSETVGASTEVDDSPTQLQRIVSRCKCEFFYASYGEDSIDPESLESVPPLPSEEGPGLWEKKEHGVDAFTLMHYDLDVCTNSLQYAMILDIVNNLLLYVEPRRKEASERLQRMRFLLQLQSGQDQRRPIQQLQNHVRSLVSKLRRLEKKTHQVQAKLIEDTTNAELQEDMSNLEKQVYECKESLTAQSDELNMMISCYKETQISTIQKLAINKGDKALATVRANEICFKHAQWRLTEADGQLGIADLVLSNFLYTKNSRSDDSVDHLLELGYIRVTNLLPSQIYTEVLCPTEIQSNMPVDQKRAVRVFCREKAPVAGISVKEHFEINVVPLTIGLTKNFYNTMLKFCFPERDPSAIDDDELETEPKAKGKVKNKKGSKESSFYVRIDRDVEKMKERADKNKLFIYIKIPEVPVKVSYKGTKEKNLEDIRDFSLTIPTLEYHNVTWTWLDLLMAMKSDSRRVILSQAIKQKLQIKMNRTSIEERASPQEEDKARMLLGARLLTNDTSNKGNTKRSIFKTNK